MVESIRESYTLVDRDENIIGFEIDEKIADIHRFLKVHREPDGIIIWFNSKDFNNDQNPIRLSMLLSVDEARHLGLSLIEQAFALDNKMKLND